jgi:hypothetical protein
MLGVFFAPLPCPIPPPPTPPLLFKVTTFMPPEVLYALWFHDTWHLFAYPPPCCYLVSSRLLTDLLPLWMNSRFVNHCLTA